MVFLSPMELVDGLTYWMFRESHSDTIVGLSGYATGWFALGAAIIGLVATALLVRRYRQVQA